MDLILKKRADVADARIDLPSSKSISNRLIIIKALCSIVETKHVADCDDSIALFHAVEFGSNEIDVGHGATPYRFLLAYLSYVGIPVVISGSESLKKRPINELVDALKELGAKIKYLEKESFPPIKIESGLKTGGSISIDASRSSQFVSALLLIAPYLKGGLDIHIEGEIVSKSYIEMTLSLMRSFGVNPEVSDSRIIVSESSYKDIEGFELEKDWSAASYFFCWMSLRKSTDASILLNSLHQKSLQGDEICSSLYQKFGVESKATEAGILIQAESMSNSIVFNEDLSSTPDIVPSIVISLCAQPGLHKIEGIGHLSYKESNRLEVLADHLEKLNLHLKIEGNNVTIDTRDFVQNENFVVNTNEDHRMAMAMASLVELNGVLRINNADVVKKSFPSFWTEYEKLVDIEYA